MAFLPPRYAHGHGVSKTESPQDEIPRGDTQSCGPPHRNTQTTPARFNRLYPASRHGTASWPAERGAVPGTVTRAVPCRQAAEKQTTCMQPFLPGPDIKFKHASLFQAPLLDHIDVAARFLQASKTGRRRLLARLGSCFPPCSLAVRSRPPTPGHPGWPS